MNHVDEEERANLITTDSLDFQCFEDRPSTYDGWPISYISHIDLAEEGFYYLKIKTQVCQAYCKGIVYDWQSDNSPKEEQYHFPLSNFARQKVISVNKDGVDVCGIRSWEETLCKHSNEVSHNVIQRFISRIVKFFTTNIWKTSLRCLSNS